MSDNDLRAAIREIYGQLGAPTWAAANLDALVDVLRDASWLPVGPIEVSVPSDVHGPARGRLREVLAQAAAATADGPRPVLLRPASGSDGRDVDGGAH